MPHFECGAFNHSATSPGAKTGRLPAPRSGRVLGEDGWPDKPRAERIPRQGVASAGRSTIRCFPFLQTHRLELIARNDRQQWDRQTRQKPAVPCRVIEIVAGKYGFAGQRERQLDASDPRRIGNAISLLT